MDFKIIKTHWPLFGVWGVFFFITLLLIENSIKNTGGTYIYPLDDVYIHLSLAKNIIQNGRWSINQEPFTSSNSSILYPLVIAILFSIFGIESIIALIFNIILTILLLAYVEFLLNRFGFSPGMRLLILIFLIFLTPIFLIVLMGMEHILHTLLMLPLIVNSVTLIIRNETESDSKDNMPYRIILLSFFSPLIRYESLLIIFFIVFLFIIRRKIKIGILLLISSLIPIIVYGIISLNKGWFFFPSSILIKVSHLDISSLVFRFLRFWQSPVLFWLVICYFGIIIQIFQKKRDIWCYSIVMGSIICVMIFIHQIIIPISYYRYDFYLIFISIVILPILFYNYYLINYKNLCPLHNSRRKWIIFQSFDKKRLIDTLILVWLMLFPLCMLTFNSVLYTSIPSYKILEKASVNIYEQQIQMANFVNKYYQNEYVMINDLGAISFYTKGYFFDLVGVGSQLSSDYLLSDKNVSLEDKLVEIAVSWNISIAIVYDFVVENNWKVIPSTWQLAGEWEIQDNVICASNRIQFYSVNSSKYEQLIDNLNNFSQDLPLDVIQTGSYTEKI